MPQTARILQLPDEQRHALTALMSPCRPDEHDERLLACVACGTPLELVAFAAWMPEPQVRAAVARAQERRAQLDREILAASLD